MIAAIHRPVPVLLLALLSLTVIAMALQQIPSTAPEPATDVETATGTTATPRSKMAPNWPEARKAAPVPTEPTSSPTALDQGDPEIEELVDTEEVFAELIQRFSGRRLALSGSQRAMPPDPVELGVAELQLRLVDHRSGNPIASTVELWRLDAPPSETWSRGDQKIAQIGVSHNGHGFSELPYGRYRAFVHAAARHAKPSPPFAIYQDQQTVVLKVRLPEDFAIHVAIHDLDGAPLAFARVRHRDCGAASSHDPQPPWVQHRRRKVPFDGIIETTSSENPTEHATAAATEALRAEADGFRIEPIHGNSRVDTRQHEIEFNLAPLVGPSTRLTPGRQRRFVSLAVDPILVCQSLRLDDQFDASHMAKFVTVKPQLLPYQSPTTWRQVPVEVETRIPGFAPLKFRFTPADLPLRRRRLQRLK